MTHATRRTLLSSLGALGLAGATAPSAAAAVTDTVTMAVNLRASAAWSGAIVVTVPAGGAVARTGKVSGAWVQATYAGRTGWVVGTYLTAIPAAVDTRAKPVTVLNRSFTHAGRSSVYHVWADQLDWSKPVGVLWYLDGDYYAASQSRTLTPTGPRMSAIAAEANRRNLVCIAVDTPAAKDPEHGWTWWVDMAGCAAYFRAFAAAMNATYRLALDRQWLFGYSGGAEQISMGLMNQQQGAWGWKGGGAVILAGGDRPATFTTAPAAFASGFRATWVVGSQDTAGVTNPPTWSALGVATAGQRFYAARGFPHAKLTVLDGVSHYGYDLPGVLRAPLDAAGIRRLR